jgi:adenosylcobinamide kinase/adenosylcobinamide-phosphate guanylyltransferase
MPFTPALLTPHLVIGGARSGKSQYAEKLITTFEPPYVYVATAQPLDVEMEDRIGKHQERRGGDWETVECPLALVESLNALSGRGRPVLLDCITIWLSNLLHHVCVSTPEERVQHLCEMLRVVDYPLVLVSNEVGCGIVPDNPLGRRFRDLAGWANQQIALACKGVTWVTAGLPLALKADAPGPQQLAAGAE